MHALYRDYVRAVADDIERLTREPADDAISRTMMAAIDGLVLQYLSIAITREEFGESLRCLTALLRGRPGPPASASVGRLVL